MKTLLTGFTLAYFALVTPILRYDYVWPDHGSVHFDVPASWSFAGATAGDVGFNFRGVPKSGAAAMLQISLLNPPPDRPVLAEELTSTLRQMVAATLPSSVEGKFTAETIKLAQGAGYYVQLTDRSLVGKPPVPGDYKVMRQALLALDQHALVIVTMQFDDPKAPEAKEMLAIVGSMRLNRKFVSVPPSSLPQVSVTRVNDTLVVSAQPSTVSLRLPESGLVSVPHNVGGSTASPRYFQLVNKDSGLILSGWFESRDHYKGLRKFWASETAGFAKAGLAAPIQVEFLKVDEWEIIAYEMVLPRPGSSNVHLRAERVKDDTWIDLHLSLTGPESAATARKKLLAIIKGSSVSAK